MEAFVIYVQGRRLASSFLLSAPTPTSGLWERLNLSRVVDSLTLRRDNPLQHWEECSRYIHTLRFQSHMRSRPHTTRPIRFNPPAYSATDAAPDGELIQTRAAVARRVVVNGEMNQAFVCWVWKQRLKVFSSRLELHDEASMWPLLRFCQRD